MQSALSRGDKATLTFGDYSVVLPDYKAKKLEEGGYNGKTVVLGIRPEDISDDPEMIQKNGDCVIESDVTGYELLGAESITVLLCSWCKHDCKSRF